MQLSNATAVGLCSGFSIAAAQTHTLVSAGGSACLLPDRGTVVRMIGWSFVFAIPVAATIWIANWFVDWTSSRHDDPLEHVQLSIAAFLVVAWGLTAIGTVAASGAKRVKLATGIDVLARDRNRIALICGALTMILGGIYIFGGHLIRSYSGP